MKNFILFAVLTFSFIAQAGPVFIGNGGNAIKIGDMFYVLDLAEQGIAEEPNFKEPINDYFYQYFTSRVRGYPNRIPATTLDLFCVKLAEIAELDPVYAEALVTAFENVRWMFINYRLTDIPVESIIAGPYFQVAARTNDVVLFDNLFWAQMDEKNHVALIFHELNYILIHPQMSSSDGKPRLEKSAFKARLQNGYLFTSNLEFIDPVEFSKRIDLLFPSRFDYKLDQLVFYPFMYKTKSGADRMAFNPFLFINGTIPGPRIASMTIDSLKDHVCNSQNFYELATVELAGISVKQDVFNGDNNSQDSTSYVETRIPNFMFNRQKNESCNVAVERLFNEVSAVLPGVFYQK